MAELRAQAEGYGMNFEDYLAATGLSEDQLLINHYMGYFRNKIIPYYESRYSVTLV